MAIFYPDILEHNNPNFALVSYSQLRGNAYAIDTLNNTGSIPSDKRNTGQIIFTSASGKFYAFIAQNTANWNTASNWKEIATTDMLGGGGGGSGGNTFATMSVFNGTSTTFILSDNPSASLFISTSNQNLTITPTAGTDTITFGFSSTPTFTAVNTANLTASSLPNLSQPNIIGYDTASGRFTYFSTSSLGSGGSIIGGSGTTNYITRWSSSTLITTSSIYESGSRIGIGTGAVLPNAVLHISGASNDNLLRVSSPTATNALFISGSGNVGIGTTTPTIALDVIGSINATGFVAGTNVFTNVVRGYLTASFGATGIDFPTTAVVHISGASNDNLLRVSSPTDQNILFVSGSGNVGIGTTTPTNTLQVGGTGISTTNLTASSLPNVSQPNIIGYDTASGRFTYFSTASLTSSFVGGNGTTNYITRWSGPNTITTSSIYESGSRIGIGTTSSLAKLHVRGVGITSETEALRVENSNASASLVVLNDRQTRITSDDAALFVQGAGVYPFTQNIAEFRYAGNGNSLIISQQEGVAGLTTSANANLNISPSGSGSTVFLLGKEVRLNNSNNNGTIALKNTGLTGEARLDFITGSSTIMSISSSGNVGIGTTSPTAKLHIYTNQSPHIGLFSRVENTSGIIIPSASSIQTKIDSTSGTITNAYNINILNSSASEGTPISNLYGVHINLLNSGSNNWAIFTSGSTRSYFGGNVGLNVTVPTHRLHVKGNSDTEYLLKVEGSTNTFIDVTNGNVLVSGSNVHLSGSLYFSASSAGNVSNSVLVRDNTTGQIKLTGSYGGGGGGVTLPSNLLSGSGTPTYIALYSGSNFLSSSNIFQNNNSFIGIGTNNPQTLLQVGGRFSADLHSANQTQVVVFNSSTKELTYMSTSSLVAGGGGTPGGINRDIQFNDGGAFGGTGTPQTFYFDKNNSGFGQGDNVHVGLPGTLQTHAQGFYTSASANYSHAEGSNTTAFAVGSHTEGYFTLTTSIGNVGGIDIKNANYSHAEGAFTTASAPYSHAEGSGSSARGDASHAEGRLTITSGSFSHAEGGSTIAFGIGSHAEGASTYAQGDYSHAEGFSTLASGTYSHAEGYDSEAKANNSHAEGNTTIVYDTATSAHTEGQQTRTYSVASHTEGYDNEIETSSPYSHIEGSANTIKQNSEGSHIEGYRNVIDGSNYSHAEGEGEGNPSQPEIKNSDYSHTEGSRNEITDSRSSHAEGDHNTIDNSSFSHAEGSFNTITTSTGSHAEGNNNLIDTSNYSHIQGIENEIKGVEGAHAEGYNTRAWAKWSHTAGSGSFASPLAIGSYVAGEGTISSGSFQHVIGRYNIPLGGTGSFIIGNGTSAANRSNIMYVDLTGSSVQITGSLLVQGTIAATNISGNISSDKITAPVGNTNTAEITTAQVHSASLGGDVIFTINGPGDYNQYRNWIYVRNNLYEIESSKLGIGLGIGAPPSYSLDVYGESNFGGPNEFNGFGVAPITPARNNNSIVPNSYGFAHGQGLIVSGSNQHAIGSYNQELNQPYSFVIGNGSGVGTRSNTLVAYGGGMASITPQVEITGSFSVTPNTTYNTPLGQFADVRFNFLSSSYQNNVLMYDTASGQIFCWTSSLQPPTYVPPTTVSLEGSIKYNNTSQTPMTNTTVHLINDAGNTAYSTTTSTTGQFGFSNVPVGNYYIRFSHNKPWGSVTSADSLLVTRHAVGAFALSGLRLKAADVNSNSTVTATDALLIARRFSGNISSFNAGDWVYGTGSGADFNAYPGPFTNGGPYITHQYGLPLTASTNIGNLEYIALCVGDVNGSYVPNILI